MIEREVSTLIGQRVYAIALGYEHLNDHDELRHDPMMSVLAGKLVTERSEGLERFRHEAWGEVEFAYATFLVEGAPELRLVTCTPPDSTQWNPPVRASGD